MLNTLLTDIAVFDRIICWDYYYFHLSAHTQHGNTFGRILFVFGRLKMKQSQTDVSDWHNITNSYGFSVSLTLK